MSHENDKITKKDDDDFDNIDRSLTVHANIHIDDIIWGINHDEAKYLIINVDRTLAEWDFTLDCFKYYVKEVLTGAKEEPDIMAEVKKIFAKHGFCISKI